MQTVRAALGCAGRTALFALTAACVGSGPLRAQSRAVERAPAHDGTQLVLIDTDIGDDIDDVFAVGLALASPELHILGISSAWSEPALKARLLDRLLTATGQSAISVAEGIERHLPQQAPLSQARWAAQQPPRPHPGAVDLMLAQIAAHPGQVTLIGLAPFTNLGAAIDRDPATFRKLKRIVIMGGSIHRGYGDAEPAAARGPDAEYNVATDIAAARKVFAAGVPLYVLPLDATEIGLDEGRRHLLFAQGTALTDAAALLYEQWALAKKLAEPTLFDPVAVAYALEPSLCPMQPMRLAVDDTGKTRETPGPPNAMVCLHADPDAFFRLYMPRLLGQHLGRHPSLHPGRQSGGSRPGAAGP